MRRFSGLSGAAARRWRRSVASHAERSRDYVRTLKFPLELEEIGPEQYGKIADLYGVTEGTDSKSLFGLLMAVHLSGFRLFSSAQKNQNFRSIGTVDQKFEKSWNDATQAHAPKLKPSALIAYFKKPVRTRGGEAKAFDKAILLKELARESGLKLADAEAEEVSLARKIIEALADELTGEFSGWDAMNQNADKAARLFDEIAVSFKVNLPSLEIAEASLSELRPEKTSMAYDSTLLTIPVSELSAVAIHQVVAQKLRMLRAEGSLNVEVKPPSAKSLQGEITTNTNNALSWLFGTGFNYWRDTSLEQVLLDFEVPDAHKSQIKELKALFLSIPKDPVFGEPHYNIFRSSLGGKVDSWVANYLGQLQKIKTALDEIELDWRPPEALREASEYLSATSLTYDQFEGVIERLGEDIDTVRNALQVLLGDAGRLPSEKDVLTIERFSAQLSGLAGIIQSICNQIDQDLAQEDRKARAQACKFYVPKWLTGLPRVNQISGGLPDVTSEIGQLEESFVRLRGLYDASIAHLLEQAKSAGQLGDPLVPLIKNEVDLLVAKKKEAGEAELQARKRLLQRLARLGSSGSAKLLGEVRTLLAPLMPEENRLNQLLYNRQGSLYRSPYSRSRHQPFSVSPEQVLALDIERALDQIVTALRQELTIAPTLVIYRDLLRIENFRNAFQLNSLPGKVPTAWLDLENLRGQVRVPETMEPLLSLETLTRDVVIRLVNLINSELSGALARAFRETFITKTKFVRVGSNALHWVPKEKPWVPPKQVEASDSALGISIRKLKKVVDVEDSALYPHKHLPDYLSQNKTKVARGADFVAPLMQQMPHDWFLDLEFQESNLEVEKAGIKVGKEGISKKLDKLKTPARLVGPPSLKTYIDHWLKDPHVKMGEYNLMFLQRFKQTVVFDSNLHPKISVEPIGTSAELALVVTDNRDLSAISHPMSQTVIGIDLGEAGIGYAVFAVDEIKGAVADGRSPEPKAQGTIPVRSVRGLIRNVARHRKKTQPNQNFKQGFSTALQELRENAAGDVCQVIDGLCAQHRGIPILETSVANLARGANQLRLVYDKVVHAYWFSDVDAHKMARRHHWGGGETWLHPELMMRENQDGVYPPKGKPQPLKHHPGSAVHPAGTSQVCSQCLRNPYELIDRASHGNVEAVDFQIDENGRVELDEGVVVSLKQTMDESAPKAQQDREMRTFRARKERPPLRYPLKADRVSADELKKSVRRQLRQGQKSTRSKDTTQSIYQCIFEDCDHRMHADENAAINIVRKWVDYRGIH